MTTQNVSSLVPYALVAGAGFLLGSIKEECGCHEPASRTPVPTAQTKPRSDDTLGFLESPQGPPAGCRKFNSVFLCDIPPLGGCGTVQTYCCPDGTAWAKNGSTWFEVDPVGCSPSEGGGNNLISSFAGGDGGGGLDWRALASFFSPIDQQASAPSSFDSFAPTPNVANYGSVPAPMSAAPAAKVDSTLLLLAGGGVLLALLMSR